MAAKCAAFVNDATVTSATLLTGDARSSFAMTIGLVKRVQYANTALGSSEQPRQKLSMLEVAPATIVSSVTTCQLFVVK